MKYEVKEVEGYMGAHGYEGNNSHLYKFNADCFKKAFKEEKINDVKVYKEHSDSYLFAITINKEDVIDFDEYLKKWTIKNTQRILCYEPDYFNYDEDKKKEIAKNLALYDYQKINDKEINQYHLDSLYYLKIEALEKIKFIKNIVDSFNYNKGNSMYDYFDSGFYYRMKLKVKGA